MASDSSWSDTEGIRCMSFLCVPAWPPKVVGDQCRARDERVLLPSCERCGPNRDSVRRTADELTPYSERAQRNDTLVDYSQARSKTAPTSRRREGGNNGPRPNLTTKSGRRSPSPRNDANRRLVADDDGRIAFRWKDYRVEGANRWKTMTLEAGEFIRRFLVHVLPKGLQRIHHCGLLANANRADAIAKARELLAMSTPEPAPELTTLADDTALRIWPTPCPCCGGRMFVIEVFARGTTPRHRASPQPMRINTS
jgi:hypothetical protein